jgi:hypothetical protein
MNLQYVTSDEELNLKEEDSSLFYTRVVRIPKIKTKEYNKTYYKKHQKERLAYGATKIQCDHCPCMIRKDGLPLHKRTKKCINFISTKKIEEDICKLVIT